MTLSQPNGSPRLVIVGSGLFGITTARLAAEQGISSIVLEKRSHPGGNAWSEVDSEAGIEVHRYGSHLFHTSNARVWDFVNRFSSFNNYQHHVFTEYKGRVFRLPLNLQTLNDFFEVNLKPDEARDFLEDLTQEWQETKDENFEARGKALVGNALYQAFFHGYTKKQWGIDPKQIPAEVLSRLPFRLSYNARYFNDIYEGLPTEGYHGLILKMLDHPLIELRLETDYFKVRQSFQGEPTVYTGPVDKYFNYQFGELGWRTLDFEWEMHATSDYQGCAVMNFADQEVPWTRIHEFRHLHPERKYGQKTIIAKEFSRLCSSPEDEPYYPINSSEDRLKLESYRQLMSNETNVVFGGRLGTYQYLDMHMAIASAMSKFDNEVMQLLF